MTLKCKNPYFDENIDRKFVFLLYSVLIAKGINLGEKFDGLFISDDKVGILETHLDYEMAVLKEASVYEAFEHCIPDGMRYNKELDKLVPDVITDFKSKEYSMTDWAKENINPNIVAFDDVEINKDEHPSKIKVESKKIVDITPEDKEILTALRQCGKSYLQIINLIKNTDTFTPSYYGAKCKCGEKLDAYAICDKYSNEHKPSAWHHAVKKLIRAGDGHKPLLKDINEVIDSLKRWKEQLNAK